ncbi:hypothetical protein ABLE92_01455 [Gordonia sp. VNQ95]|uniref:hypothetical protein n=1 Tax=Gordonia sp. VNQ95 TaxID=3156619 RepID=UPI0032B46592
MTSALYTTILAAQEQPQGPEFGKASPLGLLIIILLLVGTALLIWSMNRQLKKLPKTFDTDHPEADQAFDEGTDFDGGNGPGSVVARGAAGEQVGSEKVGTEKVVPGKVVTDKGIGRSSES